MRVTSGEFSVRKPNRQGHEWFGESARLSPKAMQAKRSSRTIPRIGDCADCSTPRAAYEWVFS